MADGRGRAAWDHTAALLAALASLLGSQQVSPRKFHPYAREAGQREERVPMPIQALRWVFVDGRLPT